MASMKQANETLITGPDVRVPILNVSTVTGSENRNEAISPIPPSTSSPRTSLMGNEENSTAGIDTPLRHALHAAAALASVTTTGGTTTSQACDVLHSTDSRPSESDQSQNEKVLSPQNLPPLIDNNVSSLKQQSAITTFPATQSQQLQPKLPVPLTLPLRVPPSIMPYNFATNPGALIHLPVVPSLGVITPGTFHQMAAAIKASEIPPIFRDRPQRSGKWTREEEVYAEMLIELFEKGHIDEKNGSTLRSFLSRKLHCAPMRISKKYAGKGIGKMVFLSKCNFRGVGDGIGSPSYHTNMQRLRQAESTFYKSCFPELNITNMMPLTSATPQPHVVPIPPPVHMLNSGVAPIAPAPGITPIYPLSNPVQAPHTTVIAPSPYWLSKPTPPYQLQAPALGVPQVTPVPMTGHLSARQSLEKAYYSVANAMQQEAQLPAGVMLSTNIAHNPVGSLNCQTSPNQTVGTHCDSSGVMERASSAPPYANNDHTKPSTTSNYRDDNTAVPQGTSNSSPSGYCSDLPDFLAGFDRIVGRNTPNKMLPTSDPAQFSPTYTSRSFDDLHRLLGKNLSPDVRQQQRTHDMQALTTKDLSVPYAAAGAQRMAIPLNLAQEGPAIAWNDDRKRNFSSLLMPKPTQRQLPQHYGHSFSRGYGDALPATAIASEFGADSYSIFAQQSAFAASQHSAYSTSRDNSDDGLMVLLGDDFELGDNDTAGNGTSEQTYAAALMSNSGFTGSSHSAVVVSEPSDQGSDETQGDYYSAGMDGISSSNESDGSYSESSRKKARLSHHVYDDTIPANKTLADSRANEHY